MATLYDLYDAVSTAVGAAITAVGIPTSAQVYKGWPAAEDLTSILAGQQYAVSVFDGGHSTNIARYIGTDSAVIVPVNVPLSAVVTPGAVAFSTSAAIPAGLNVHTFVGRPYQDAAIQTAAGDTTSTVATKVAAAVNALAIPGVVATPSGASVLVPGSPFMKCNIGGSATIGTQVGRIGRRVQVSVWTPNALLRNSVTEAILTNVGTADRQFYTLTDGTIARIRYHSDVPRDDSQTDYSLYEHHIFFECELPQLRAATAYEVLSFGAQVTTPSGTITEVGG